MTAEATKLLTEIQTIEQGLKACEAVINKARKHANGLTLEEDKTIEWRKAKTEYGRLFIELRKANQQLNKLRKFSHYENVNGKLTAVYQYK